MKTRNPLILFTLILSGEMIFILPFILVRVFRPTVLTVFGLSNLQLGVAFAVYGVVALSSYFFGGIIADKFPANRLISISLIATGLGGIYMSTVPSFDSLLWLYGFWGMTTILLFWAAMIRATRIWGGPDFQGRAFGFLEGGRGLVAAIIATLGVTIFTLVLPDQQGAINNIEVIAAFKKVILVSSIIVIITGLFVWFMLRGVQNIASDTQDRISLANIKSVLRRPTVWLQGIIIICAYTGYKATDNFSLFASDILGYDDIASAKVGTLSIWLRPVAAVGAGYLADRVGGLKMTGLSFAIVTLGALGFASGFIVSRTVWLFFLIMMTTSLGIYALRGLYFAITKEGNIPVALTGTAVGIMSVVGYTPDIFMGPVMGYLLDRSPGLLGHQHLFLFLAFFSVLGGVATYVFYRVTCYSK